MVRQVARTLPELYPSCAIEKCYLISEKCANLNCSTELGRHTVLQVWIRRRLSQGCKRVLGLECAGCPRLTHGNNPGILPNHVRFRILDVSESGDSERDLLISNDYRRLNDSLAPLRRFASSSSPTRNGIMPRARRSRGAKGVDPRAIEPKAIHAAPPRITAIPKDISS